MSNTQANIIISLVALVLVSLILWGAIATISKVSEDIRAMVGWNDNITFNGGIVIATGAHISIWKDKTGKIHAGFIIENKQYELEVIE